MKDERPLDRPFPMAPRNVERGIRGDRWQHVRSTNWRIRWPPTIQAGSRPVGNPTGPGAGFRTRREALHQANRATMAEEATGNRIAIPDLSEANRRISHQIARDRLTAATQPTTRYTADDTIRGRYDTGPKWLLERGGNGMTPSVHHL